MAKQSSVITLRLSEETRLRVAAFMSTAGCKNESAALRELIECGLTMAGSSLLPSPLARFVREVMQGQLDLFRREMEAKADEIEDRVAKVCSRGTKASLHSAALMGDVARGSIPAFRDMGAEDIWRTYEAIGGAVQQGASLADARRQARERR